ncbi:alpha/beta fold hydrolase [Allobranchiibius huperziae]|uniref:Pimeloyl-ACP methyl ester carboxylesterase n=1 Tax=Allobranchiibius huperziae TaxID=1874116 RepID=A0A853DJH1_9MICO|nr:pimeloyl-ACP methyl ester carboxylesterase [Allobranchiibius huperziae]
MIESALSVDTGDITMETFVDGVGPDVLLVHGFPHTRLLWSRVADRLIQRRRVIAPDLRGTGGSTRAADGYDADSLSTDLGLLLDRLGSTSTDIVAIDAGVPPAFLLALREPDRVRRLVLMESTLGVLPGAEDFFRAGPPWWFGFHQVPGLAEVVLEGHEDDYLDFFYRTGTFDGSGIDAEVRDAFVASYSGRESLRCAFEIYRAMPQTAAQIADAVAGARLRVPTLAIGAQPVGDALHRQLTPIADDLRGALVPKRGHIIPLDQPDALVTLLDQFLD